MRSAWCVFSELHESAVAFSYECHSERGSIALTDALNRGARICRGAVEFNSACGHCPKCVYSKHKIFIDTDLQTFGEHCGQLHRDTFGR